jgi:hypothetical protein
VAVELKVLIAKLFVALMVTLVVKQAPYKVCAPLGVELRVKVAETLNLPAVAGLQAT